MNPSASHSPALPAETVDEAVSRELVKALRGLAHGTITLTVHDSRVVTIERLERTRLAPQR